MIDEENILKKIRYIKQCIKQSSNHASELSSNARYVSEGTHRADFIHFNFKHYSDALHSANIGLSELEDMITGEDYDV